MGDIAPVLLRGAIVTAEVALGAWLIGAIAGLGLALVRELGGRASIPLIGIVAGLRSLPELVILYLAFFGLGSVFRIEPVVAAIAALGITEAAFVSEYYRASFLTVGEAQREAGASLGLSRLQVMRLVVLPQAIPMAIPPLVNSFAGLLKSATLASAIGAGEVLSQAQNEMLFTGNISLVLTAVIILYLAITIPITRMAGMLERHVRSQARA